MLSHAKIYVEISLHALEKTEHTVGPAQKNTSGSILMTGELQKRKNQQ
jgi:hypothetical protein